MSTSQDEAVVIGGSMAGMTAAAVLSSRFKHVTIVEADDLPDKAMPRVGVPQSFHLHGLLTGGRMKLDAIYGNWTDEALRAGGVPFDPARQQALRLSEGWLRRAPSDLTTVTASRWVLEHVVRELTRAISNVDFRQGRVSKLVATGDRITGAAVLGEDGDEVLKGDLVIDATGRASRSPQWLEELGYQAPTESVVNPFLGYATVRCHVPDDAWPGDWNAVVAPPFPGESRGGFITQEEDGLVGLMAAGSGRDYPPGDKEGFTEWLRTAVTPIFHDIWMQAEPQSDIKTTKTSVNRMRHWDQVPRRPKGFLPIGDAVTAFNPVYGQGITVAAMQATVLGERLDESDTLDEAIDKLYGDVVRESGFAWSAAIGADMGFATTEVHAVDEPSAADTEDGNFFLAVRALSVTDPYVAVEFNRAIGLMQPELLRTPEITELVKRYHAQPAEHVEASLNPPLWSEKEAPPPEL